jgi:hypothetical protein
VKFVNNTGSEVTLDGDMRFVLGNPDHKGYVKVYYQLKTVKYADYKVGYYYVSPSLLSEDFRDPEKLF